MSFILDVITALPIDAYLSNFTAVPSDIADYFNLIRLLKGYRMMKFIHNLQDNNWNYPMMTRFVKYFCTAAIIMYFLAAFMFAFSCKYYDLCDYSSLKLRGTAELVKIQSNILISTYFVLGLVSGLYNDTYYQFDLIVYWVSYLFCFMGYIFLSFCFSEFCALFVLRSKHENEYKGEMLGLRIYLFNLHLPKALFRKLQDYLIFMWQFNENTVVLGKDSVMVNASKEIRDQVLFQKFLSKYYL